MKIGIVVKPTAAFSKTLTELLQWLQERGCRVLLEKKTAETYHFFQGPATSRQKLADEAEIILVFGGDGTFLSVARAIQHRQTPVLGVNLGSLGFLTEVTLPELYPALEAILQGRYEIEPRRLVQAQIRRTGRTLAVHHALNDMVINRRALAGMIILETYVDHGLIARFLADGLIISTPTGSTAYSLSAGGPIVFPTLQALVITPICPHTLTNRPVVVPADCLIRVVLRSGDEATLAVDGQVGIPLKEDDEVICSLSPHSVQLLKPAGKNFFDVLREKLRWGER